MMDEQYWWPEDDDAWLEDDDLCAPDYYWNKEPRPGPVPCIGRYHHIAGSKHRSGWRVNLKRMKSRSERHRARLNPEVTPGYGRYWGWWW